MKKYIKVLLPLILMISGVLTACEIPVPSSSSSSYEPISTSRNDEVMFRTTFLNDDGTFLYASLTAKGTTAVYKGPTPTRPSTRDFEYTFIGWDESLEYIEQDTIFHAQYAEKLIIYHRVQFVNYDDSLLYEQEVQHGKNAFYGGPTPTRQSDNNVKYTFSQWSRSLLNITEDTTIVAQYTGELKPYEVKFVNYDDSLLDIVYVLHGDSAIYAGAAPTRPSTEAKSYRFIGWDGDYSYVTSDRTLRAQFAETVTQFTVTFLNYDGSYLYDTLVEYGKAASFNGPTPSKSPKGPYQYEFDGWDKNINVIVSNLTVRALFKEKPRQMSDGIVFSYDSETDSYYVSSYQGNQKDIYIAKTHTTPTYGEKIVRRIGSHAFNGNYTLESVYLENTIISIDVHAFSHTSRLKEIRLSANLESIGDYAFSYSGLEKIEIPARVFFIGRNLFYGAQNLKDVIIDNDNPTYASDGVLLTSKDGKKLYQAFSSNLDEDFVVPEGIETIEQEALHNKNFRTLSLPSTLKELKPYSVSYNNNLKKVIFNDSPTIIGESAVAYCSNLAEVEFGTQIKKINSNAFRGTQLTHIKLPASLEYVSSSSFDNIKTITQVSLLGESELYVIYENSLLTKSLDQIVILALNNTSSFTIPDALTYIDPMQFASNQFSNIFVASGNRTFTSMNGVLFKNNGSELVVAPGQLRDYTVPVGVTSIGQSAFYRHGSINSISFPSSVKKIASEALYEVQSLSKVTFSEGLETIGSYAFFNTGIKELIFPDSLVSTDDYAFYNLPQLEKIAFGKGLTKISYATFQNATSLKELVLSNEITEIGPFAFYNNSNLDKITFGEGLKIIQYYAFSNNNNLKKLVLPDSLEVIYDNAFSYNYALTELVCGARLKEIKNYVFYNNYSLVSVTFNSALEKIGSYAFANCNLLTSLVIPSGVKTIQNNAFNYCGGLTYIDIGSSLTSLGSSTFAGANQLTAIVINTHYSSWSYSALNGSVNIKEIFYRGTDSTVEANIRAYFSFVNQENLSIYFYSEVANYDGKHWRYVDGIATVWVQK